MLSILTVAAFGIRPSDGAKSNACSVVIDDSPEISICAYASPSTLDGTSFEKVGDAVDSGMILASTNPECW